MLKDRLKLLIADQSISAFARKVKMSESLIRKYLKGSEPSLQRAVQIAAECDVSLEWLATGRGKRQEHQQLLNQAMKETLYITDSDIQLVMAKYESLSAQAANEKSSEN